MKGFFRKNSIVLAGGTIQGFGMGVFLFPHAIPSGGAGGIAVLLNHLVGLNMGIALWIVNFSMLVLAVRFLGNRVALWTMVSITATSFSIYLFQQVLHLPDRIIWVDLLLGSIFLGTGIGLLLRQGVSNGGVGVIALIISSSRNTLPGKPLFLINGFIFILTASVISWDIIFQALLSQWISTKMVDYVCGIDFYQVYTLGWRKK
ncbi:YitT family protein [Bacillus sp. T33-2]|uniref:YitT family protein n=1 Tax=Bacillus sp. T33-2 TaxID=2054168 RepID=UPI000C7904FC|nr:YitT family protein [Bacillus sp. T33-2]PLR95241.1 membrane protein [Bacillus sp. T33-2]